MERILCAGPGDGDAAEKTYEGDQRDDSESPADDEGGGGESPSGDGDGDDD